MGRNFKTVSQQASPLRQAITEHCWHAKIDSLSFTKMLSLTRQTVYNAGNDPFKVKRAVLEKICHLIFKHDKLACDTMLIQCGIMPIELAKLFSKHPEALQEFLMSLPVYTPLLGEGSPEVNSVAI